MERYVQVRKAHVEKKRYFGDGVGMIECWVWQSVWEVTWSDDVKANDIISSTITTHRSNERKK